MSNILGRKTRSPCADIRCNVLYPGKKNKTDMRAETTKTAATYKNFYLPQSCNAILPEYNKTKCNNIKALQHLRCSASLQKSTKFKTRPCNVSVVVPASGKSCGVEGHRDGGGKEEQAGQNNNGELNR